LTIRTAIPEGFVQAGGVIIPFTHKDKPSLLGIPPDLPSVGTISPDPRPEEAISRTGCTPKKVEVILEKIDKVRGARAYKGIPTRGKGKDLILTAPQKSDPKIHRNL
jgi:hypothetical protein